MSVVLIIGCRSGSGEFAAISFAKRDDTIFVSMPNTGRSPALRDVWD
jgi:NAD(P)-dependent dehydrogenase (short-subunit alcohol dehydrogenase family)